MKISRLKFIHYIAMGASVLGVVGARSAIIALQQRHSVKTGVTSKDPWKKYDEKQRIVIEKYHHNAKESRNLCASRIRNSSDIPKLKQRQLESSMELGKALHELMGALVNMEEDEDKKRKMKREINRMLTEPRYIEYNE